MKEKWLTIGLNASEMRSIEKLINIDNGEIIKYIHDFHFPHYDSEILPTGRMPMPFTKHEAEIFMKKCKDNNVSTTLILNYGNYEVENIKRALEDFYFPLGLESVVVSNMSIAKELKELYPNLTLHGSCISYIDSISGLLNEASFGIELHNPAVWTIRNMDFIKEVNRLGLKQKHIMSEGCARKCKLERWHRKESSIGVHHGLNETCRKSIRDIYTLLMGSWVTIKQLKRMEDYIDVLKVPRNTFDDITQLKAFIERFDSGEPYNILDYFSTPLLEIKYNNIIMSDIFDDEFFDRTSSDLIDKDFLDGYVAKMEDVPFFNIKSGKLIS